MQLGQQLLASGSFVRNYLERPTIESLMHDHMRGRRNEELRLWTLLGLEVWQRTFLRDTANLVSAS